MNAKVVTGVVVVLALVVVGWWYWTLFTPQAVAPTVPEESVNDVALPTADMNEAMVGTWRSDTDSKFVREFSASGTVTDSYEGAPDATVTGQWTIVTDPSTEPASLPVVKDARILKIAFPEEVLYFAVTGVSDNHLSLLYLAGAGTLEFTRVR